MAAQQQLQRQIKVLRIGILQDGKIVQEKRIRQGETVTIGESSKSTFSYPIAKLPKRFPIFVAKGEEYTLRVVDAMSGKVAYRDGVLDLDQLKKKGYATKKGDAWVLPIQDKNRGKITIDNITVLFQFVPAPPEPLRPVTKKDFRPKLIDEDDPAFIGFLGFFTLAALVFVIYVQNTEYVEMVSADDIPDRFVEVALAPPTDPKPDEDIELEIEADGMKVKAKAKEPEPSEGGGKQSKAKGPVSEEERQAAEIKRKQAMEESVMEKSLLLKMIGTRGETTSGSVVEDLFADGDGGSQDLDAALRDVGGVEVGTAEAMLVKEGQGAGTGRVDASIGDLARTGGGDVGVGSGPSTKVVGKVTEGEADVVGGDPGKVKSVVKANNGSVLACYEQRLKENPNLGGRIEIGWVIAKGRVTSPHIVYNNTRDDALAECIVSKIQRWRFPTDMEEESMEVVYPFILSSG